MGPWNVSAALTVLIVAGGLILVMRWVFRPSRPRGRAPMDASDSPDLGLLAVIATGLPRVEAARQRAALGAAGISASVSRRHDGTMDVLVFTADVGRARALLGP